MPMTWRALSVWSYPRQLQREAHRRAALHGVPLGIGAQGEMKVKLGGSSSDYSFTGAEIRRFQHRFRLAPLHLEAEHCRVGGGRGAPAPRARQMLLPTSCDDIYLNKRGFTARVDDVARWLAMCQSSICSPRHTMTINSRKEGSTCVSMTWRAASARPCRHFFTWSAALVQYPSN